MTSHKDRCLCSSNERRKHNISGHAAAPYVLADTGVTYVDLERPRFVMCAAEYVWTPGSVEGQFGMRILAPNDEFSLLVWTGPWPWCATVTKQVLHRIMIPDMSDSATACAHAV